MQFYRPFHFAFPYGEGGSAKPRRMRGNTLDFINAQIEQSRVGADAHIGPKVRLPGVWSIPTAAARKGAGRCGHRPLRERQAAAYPGPVLSGKLGPSSVRAAPCHLPRRGRLPPAGAAYSTPRRYRPLVQAPGSKLVGVRYSSRIRSTSRAFSVVKFSRMAQRPSLLRSFCRSSQ